MVVIMIPILKQKSSDLERLENLPKFTQHRLQNWNLNLVPFSFQPFSLTSPQKRYSVFIA